jgi:Ca2+-binding RTX toxin-like protein
MHRQRAGLTMVDRITETDLDKLVGMTFSADALANVTVTAVDGSITNTTSSPNQVVTYDGTTGTVGSQFLASSNARYIVVDASDSDDTLTIDAYVGSTLAAELDFTVIGLNGGGIGLSTMPVDSLITQSSNLSSLNGTVYLLGLDATGSSGQSLTFTPDTTYALIPSATVAYATSAHPTLTGTTGPEMLIATSGNDTITAGSGRTVIEGGSGTDTFYAGSGIDRIYAGSGDTTIWGGSGKDTLYGGSGETVMHAGTGQTTMVGGSGADTFAFAPGHTGGLLASTADVIEQLHTHYGDVIDLSAFDSELAAGSHLSFIGTAAFDGHAGEVRYSVSGSTVTIQGDMTGAKLADFTIVVHHSTGLIASNFIL